MKIGLNTDSVGRLTLDETLDLTAELGLDCVEFAPEPGPPALTSTSTDCSPATPRAATCSPR
ncbi:hypothetical protein [Streptomyces sp. MBT53]|uniref:hypothetical protein n=1 Tax=Streptomyces sp. MBT53 TaxID=1488384 RepID=UPI001911506C|nr:hypothetical protein [Streptomyces sp. MBT53]MBK6012304.1 hypothetical protein [Streptomyces sp. MBT53]